MTLAASVLRTIRRDALIEPGGRVVVALSGGPDSVALVYLLRELRTAVTSASPASRTSIISCAGRRRTRTKHSAASLAAELSLPIECGTADVRFAARQQRRSIEDAARALRYRFLEQAADRLGADRIAIGHSRDDQAETFLLRLLRGSGPRGLAGILPRAGRVDPAAARCSARRTARLRRVAGPGVQGRCDQQRSRNSPQPGQARAAAISGARVLARDQRHSRPRSRDRPRRRSTSPGGRSRSGRFDRLI